MKNKYLGVNIDHIATIRQARGTRYPEVLQAALVAEQAGADSITLHLREDRRHIQQRDVEMIKGCLQSKMNLEMATTAEMLDIAKTVQPEDCCLVPEKREELTTEGGLDVAGNIAYMQDYCAQLADANIRVSLFIDADFKQIEAAHQIGAPVIEIHTGHYADAVGYQAIQTELDKIKAATIFAKERGLIVNAGHGLNYHNVKNIIAIDDIEELNIGHAIIAQALFDGLAAAVKEMKKLITN